MATANRLIPTTSLGGVQAHSGKSEVDPITVSSQASNGTSNDLNKKKKRRRRKSSRDTPKGEAQRIAASELSDNEDLKPADNPSCNGTTVAHQTSTEVTTETATKLDPTNWVLQECVNYGFKAGDVQDMMSAMFDTNKAYDHPPAVMRELDEKKHRDTHARKHTGRNDNEMSAEAAEPLSYDSRGCPEHQHQQQQARLDALPSRKPRPAQMSSPPMAGLHADTNANGRVSPPAELGQRHSKQFHCTNGTVHHLATQGIHAIPQQSDAQVSPKVVKTRRDIPPDIKKDGKALSALNSRIPSPTTCEKGPDLPPSASSTAGDSSSQPAAALCAKSSSAHGLAALREGLSCIVSNDNIAEVLEALMAFLLIADYDGWKVVLEDQVLESICRTMIVKSLEQPKVYPSCIANSLGPFLTVLVGDSEGLGPILDVLRHLQDLGQVELRVLESVIQGLAGVLREASSDGQIRRGAFSALRTLEGQLEQVGRLAAVGSESDLPELFAAREQYAAAVALQEEACRLLIQQLTEGQGYGKGKGTSIRPRGESKDIIVNTLLQETLGLTLKQVQDKQREIAAVKAEAGRQHQALESQLRPLIDESHQDRDHLARLQFQRESLLRQLAEVDGHIDAMEARVRERESLMCDRQLAYQTSVADSKQRLESLTFISEQAATADRLGQKFDSLITHMHVGAEAARSHQRSALEIRLQDHIVAFAAGLEPALELNVRCYRCLRDRVAATEASQAKIQRELEHYRSMGLTLTSGNMTEAAEKNAVLVQQDWHAMRTLVENAEREYRAFRAALDKVGGPGSDWMIQRNLSLVGIKQALDDLGLAKDWLPGLNELCTSPAASVLRAPPPPAMPSPASVPSLSFRPPQRNAPVSIATTTELTPAAATSPPRTAPASKKPPMSHADEGSHAAATGAGHATGQGPVLKLSWATRHTPAQAADTAERKSLPQIQEEQRQISLTQESLRQLESVKAKAPQKDDLSGEVPPPQLASSDASLNSTTAQTLGSEGNTWEPIADGTSGKVEGDGGGLAAIGVAKA